MKDLVIASTSTLYNGAYLEYLLEEIESLFSNTEEILFIPYARPGGITHDVYTEKASEAFDKVGKGLTGIHTTSDALQALRTAKGIFTGGGNTFVLVSALYQHGLMQPLREVLFNGTPYLGTSAGSNICGLSMQTTNDMPIVYPPTFKTLSVVPFNINPHYLDPVPGNTHMGETRETRIREFHAFNQLPVIGLREGSWIRVQGTHMILAGNLQARIFEKNKTPYEVEPGTQIDYF